MKESVVLIQTIANLNKLIYIKESDIKDLTLECNVFRDTIKRLNNVIIEQSETIRDLKE